MVKGLGSNANRSGSSMETLTIISKTTRHYNKKGFFCEDNGGNIGGFLCTDNVMTLGRSRSPRCRGKYSLLTTRLTDGNELQSQ